MNKSKRKIAKKQIRPILRTMKLNETVIYSQHRSDEVRATVYRLQNKYLKRWATKKKGDYLEVTRIA